MIKKLGLLFLGALFIFNTAQAQNKKAAQYNNKIIKLQHSVTPDVVAFFRKYFGPTQMTFARLDESGQKALAAELTEHWARNNQGDPNHTVIKAEYLEVHATLV